ncbi:MAG TPA: protein-disulfide reductase DsbD domain-containing protein [Pyrinomonadaceae bacterium]|nr:protein-disulfide reductase DsbD domain-containing protein [Pyrinomonadaceae bacterium]
MSRHAFIRHTPLFICALALLFGPPGRAAAPSPLMPQANIGVNGFYAADKVQQGRALQAAIVLDIPDGFHVNANRLTNKFLIPTELKIDAPKGWRISAVSYPRAVVRRLSFSKDPVQLYEGRAVMRFSITVPANFNKGVAELRARVHYQSCNNEVCYPPTSRDVTLPIAVVGATESVKRINGQYFGGRRK